MKKTITLLLLLSSILTYGQDIVKELSELYKAKEYDKVIEKATPHLKTKDLRVDINLLMGRSLADKGQFKEAINYLKYTEKKDKKEKSWRKAWALAYLGNCYFMTGNIENAEEALKECLKLNATKNASAYAQKSAILFGFTKPTSKFDIVESKNFIFHFQSLQDTEKTTKYTEEHEDAYKEISKFFKTELPKKIDFFVWDKRDDAKETLGKDLGFAVPIFCIVHAHKKQTIGHEMTHIISHYSATPIAKKRFINEGTAVYFNQEKDNNEKLVKKWMKKSSMTLNIKDFWANGERYPEVILYPLGGLVVKELIKEFGKKQYLEFFKNQTYENAKAVFGADLDTLITELELKLNKG